MTKLLVVDDDLLSTEFVRLYLVDKGFEVFVAGSVVDAVAILREHSPVGVFTDLQLGDGSGVDVAKQARESGATFVVGISGYDRVTLEQQGLCLESFSELLPKPLDLSRLDEVLGRVR